MTLAEDYKVAVNRPAEEVYDYRLKGEKGSSSCCPPTVFLRDKNSRDGQPLAWVIPNILSDRECDDLIERAESFGLHPPGKATLRTSKRTMHYTNQELSDRVFPRIQSPMEEILTTGGGDDDDDQLKTGGPVYGIHSNWRVVRYDPGDAFPAHQDQMDSFQLKHEDGTKDLVVSSHTLLIHISQNADAVCGGATRFYYPTNNKKLGTASGGGDGSDNNNAGPYGHAVDVFLPRGWGLVFRQKGLIHAGQPVLEKGGDGNHHGVSKYVAQAGILRVLPPNQTARPSIFRLGPGLQEALEELAANYYHTELLNNHAVEATSVRA